MWAFGVGLERLCMICFEIPDIRYFWSQHPRFLDQFKRPNVKFQKYSEVPSQKKDISFWIPESQLKSNDDGSDCSVNWSKQNDFFELVREIGGEYVESIKWMDAFYHQKKKEYSHTYTILYSPCNPTLNDPGMFTKMINNLHKILGTKVNEKLYVSLR
jgi:phenylalanyl-tRNA synthetase alpha chain